MRILIACEESGTVRDAFIKKGHDAISCDIIPTSSPGPHIQGDVLEVINDGWDMMIAFPPCTFLTTTGLRWFYHPDDAHLPVHMRRPHPKYPDRQKDRESAMEFFMAMATAPIPKVAIENPVGVMSTRYRKPDQYIQPYEFGHHARKKTCLWLFGLPPIKPSNIVKPKLITLSNGKTFSEDYMKGIKRGVAGEASRPRSITYPGIADAMAEQWG